MVGVCCGCIAKPASVQPRKTYNLMIAGLFGGEPIATDAAIDSTTRRKIQKLQEYLQANPAKIPKVSRRLMRKIRATLLKPGNNLGHVKVAVHAYTYLLARSADEISSYGPDFFSKELLVGQDAVVPLLLRDIHIEMRTLGAELLAVFTEVQTQADCKLDAIQAHTPQVCRVAQGALAAGRKEQKLQETTERRRAGDVLAVPDPIYLIGRRDPAHVAALEVACLRCLQALVALCKRSKVVPLHISAIQAVMLDNLRSGRAATAGGADGSTSPAARQPSPANGDHKAAAGSEAAAAAAGAAAGPGVVDSAFYASMGMQAHLPQGSQPRELAEQLLLQMARFTQDIAMVNKILHSFYDYMDDTHSWQEQAVVKNFMAVLTPSGGRHHFPTFASLLRHAACHKLAAADCEAVLQLAGDQGAQLHEAYSLAALSLALHEVPRAWAEQARKGPKVMPMQAFLALLRAGTAAVKDLTHLPSISEAPAAAQQRAAAAAAAGGPRAPSAAAAAGAGGSAEGAAAPAEGGGTARAEAAAAFQQQLAQLKGCMLATVRTLATRVGSAAELCEAVAAVLSSVGAELQLSHAHVSHHHHHRAAAHGPAGGDAGVGSAFAARAATPPPGGSAVWSLGGAAAAAGAAAGGDVDADEVSAAAGAVMALECAAAATEAFVQQQQPQPAAHVLTTKDSRSAEAAAGSFTLAGGVLPPSLVAAALPLIAGGPGVVRRAVQRILLTLLPAAVKGVASDKQAGQLIDVVLTDMRRARLAAVTAEAALVHDAAVPGLAAAADALVRCCLRGPAPWPAAVLAVSRALLQLRHQWAEGGYRSSGRGSSVRAHALLLLSNSLLVALADATGHAALLSQQLPLDAAAFPALQATPRGLVVNGAAADASGSLAALRALEQQLPATQEHVAALRTTLSQVPALQLEYGQQLPALLDAQLGMRQSAASSEGGSPDKPLTHGNVNALLTKRMSTLRKELVHVSELMRDSMSHIQDITPAAVLAARTGEAPPTPPSHSAAGGSATAAGALAAAAASSNSSSGKGSSGAAAAAAANGTASSTVSPGDVQLQGLAGATGGGGNALLLSRVADALAAPVPMGTLVVQDVQISRLAGELDLLLLG